MEIKLDIGDEDINKAKIDYKDSLHKQIYILKKETTELQDKNEFFARELKRSISQLDRNEHTKMEKRVEELEQRLDCLRIVSSTQYECDSCGDY